MANITGIHFKNLGLTTNPVNPTESNFLTSKELNKQINRIIKLWDAQGKRNTHKINRCFYPLDPQNSKAKKCPFQQNCAFAHSPLFHITARIRYALAGGKDWNFFVSTPCNRHHSSTLALTRCLYVHEHEAFYDESTKTWKEYREELFSDDSKESQFFEERDRQFLSSNTSAFFNNQDDDSSDSLEEASTPAPTHVSNENHHFEEQNHQFLSSNTSSLEKASPPETTNVFGDDHIASLWNDAQQEQV